MSTTPSPSAKKKLGSPVNGEDIQLSEAPRIIASGFAMGSADIVPGVSGGTMAVACGIYGELLGAIASIDKTALLALLRFDLKTALARVHLKFLSALFLGIVLAVLIMIKVVKLPHLLVSHTNQVYALFFGLVFASIFVLAKRVHWRSSLALSALLGAALGLAVVNLVPVDTPSSASFMFLYGAVAISAMLLPGISGSFILLILGQYEVIIGALESLVHLQLGALAVVVPFGFGCLFGITTFSRIVSYALRRFHDPVLAGLAGLLFGSLWRIWPFQETVTQEVRGKLKVVQATPFWPETFEWSVFALFFAGILTVIGVELLAKLKKA